VSVRVTKNTAEWVRTLVPYRNYFRSTYGAVRYQREETPVWGTLASDPANCSASNPLGWNGPWRPDLNGWSSMATLLRENSEGWGGTMIWIPGGSYWHNTQKNVPCTPASPWLSSPKLATIFDHLTGMPSVGAAGKDLGFWWGHSCQTAALWDPPAFQDFDPDNPVHYKRHITELDLMAKAGATMIGLDTFDPVNTPFWKQYQWMETMRLRYPKIKYVTEPTNCDIMHTMAANYITGFELFKVPATEEDYYLLKHPNYLADFLVPGHEYWGSFAYNALIQHFGVTPSLSRVLSDMQRYASYGYRPVFMVEATWWGVAIPPGSVRAARTWETTVPADLQISAQPDGVRKALSTGSRPTKAGANAVAGFKPSRTGQAGPRRVDTFAGSGKAVSGRAVAVQAGAASAPDPRMNSKSQQRRVADAIRRSRGLPPLPPEDPPADNAGSEVQTFVNEAPAQVPATMVPSKPRPSTPVPPAPVPPPPPPKGDKQ
jgi:hypothetical protein